ncbi:hypothetical protein [Paenisporosarcina sp. TG-14]|uniref:hypothetical protein n=1 Tax=Paenisporosarcina sp. TG-14 TaxID=1231057 RepID=UPI0002E91BCF|nr:hypothetical protein [Paenisporosarcina sp. TG-14]
MEIYLICYDFPTKDKESTNKFLQSIGDHCRAQNSVSLLATDLGTQEIHDKIRDFTDIVGEWIVTKVDKSFTGNSENVAIILAFLKKHDFKNY